MGSFNTSCFASNQTISPGVLTYIFPIHQQTSYKPINLTHNEKPFTALGCANSGCYTVANWGYCGPILLGTYFDYGRFELLDSPSNRINLLSFFEYLSKNLFQTHEGKNQYHDIGIKFETLYQSSNKQKYSFKQLHDIWDEVWSVTQEYRAFIAGKFDGQPKALQFAVMHHACAKYLLELAQTTETYQYDNPNEFLVFSEFLKEHASTRLSLTQYDDNWDERFSEFIVSMPSFCFGRYEGVNIGAHYGELFEPVFEIVVKHKASIEKGLIEDTLINDLFNVVKAQLDHRFINTAMEQLNIKLSPMTYTGQDYSNEIGAAYAKMIRRVSHLVSKEARE